MDRIPPIPTVNPLAARSTDARRILLVATMRNEGPFILEWVAYHRAIGFTDLVVCTNDCVDDSPELLDRLQELGHLTHLRQTSGGREKAQLAAYALAEKLPVIEEASWAMVLNADEFLNIHVGNGCVTDLIEAAPAATAFLINWRVFGSAGKERWLPGFVTERFTQAAKLSHGVNLPFKTLFSKADAYHCRLLPHQPRFPRKERLSELLYVNGGGDVLPAYFHDESQDDFLQSAPGTVSWRLAQVNHYNTRSWDDYLVKHHRGGGLDTAWRREECWAQFNRNEEEDRSIQPKLERARQVFQALLDDPLIRTRHERCCSLYAEHVARLRGGMPSMRAAG